MRQEAAAAEGLQERLRDLHDKLSHAILPLSACARAGAPAVGGCVVSRRQQKRVGRRQGGDRCSAAADARSLHAIRAALEGLEGHLHFPRNVLAQRDAAIARLQQSRNLLATRLAEHRWRKNGVFEETLAFVNEVLDKTWFASQLDVRGMHNQSEETEIVDSSRHVSNFVVRLLSCSLYLVTNSIRLDRIGGVLGNTEVFALGMLAFLQLQQVAFHKQSPAVECRKIDYCFHSGSSGKYNAGLRLQVSFARG